MPQASILIFVWTPPEWSKWRAMLRPHLAVFTHGMQSEVRFTCMPPPMNSSSIIASLEAEQRAHDDLAMLTGPTEINPSGRKYWLMLAWALRFRPKVDVILKQESDVIVDWRRAVPAMLQQVATAEGRFLVGRFCDPKLCMPMRRMGRCAGGMVNGMSAGFARWLTSSVELEGCDALAGCDATNSSSGARWRLRAGPQDGAPAGRAAAAAAAGLPYPRRTENWRGVVVEDIQLCEWASAYDRTVRGAPQSQSLLLDRRGIIYNESDRFWVHRLKVESAYAQCMKEAVTPGGCARKDGAPWCARMGCVTLTLRLPRDHLLRTAGAAADSGALGS